MKTVSALAPYRVCFYLKDLSIKRTNVRGLSISGTPLGTDVLNVKALLNMVEEAGRDSIFSQYSLRVEMAMRKKPSKEKRMDNIRH